MDFIYSNRLFIDEEDQIIRFWILPPHLNYCMSRWDFIPQETCFWRRSLMDQVGSVDPSYSFALDYDLFVRMMARGSFRRLNKFIAAFRIHSSAKSANLYHTVGIEEIQRVRNEQDIRIHWYDNTIKYLFGGGILSVSWIYRLLMLGLQRKRISTKWGK